MTHRLTFQGGPVDGKTIDAPDDCMWINVPSVWPVKWPRFDPGKPTAPPVFYMHVYDAHTGIYHHGRMPSERIRINRVSLFDGWVGRWLDRIDRWLA